MVALHRRLLTKMFENTFLLYLKKLFTKLLPHNNIFTAVEGLALTALYLSDVS